MKVSPISPVNIPPAHNTWAGMVGHGEKKRSKAQVYVTKHHMQHETYTGSLLLYDGTGTRVNYTSYARVVGEI